MRGSGEQLSVDGLEMAAPKGTMPPAAGMGRRKGSKNKLPADVRNMVLEALERVGGVEYLVERATDQPKAFMSLVGHTMPKEVKGELLISLSDRMRQILASTR
jgi:hypothetical protein